MNEAWENVSTLDQAAAASAEMDEAWEDGIALDQEFALAEQEDSQIKITFVMGKSGALSCPSGTRRATQSECSHAPRALRLNPGVIQKNNAQSPAACMYYATGRNVWYNRHPRGVFGYRSWQPICVRPQSVPPVPTPSPSQGLPQWDFEEWMKYWQNQNTPMGGWACGYDNGWCGCGCGHNQGKENPCTLPKMEPGTKGGRTCGHFGRFYGCVETHNTLKNCPGRGAQHARSGDNSEKNNNDGKKKGQQQEEE